MKNFFQKNFTRETKQKKKFSRFCLRNRIYIVDQIAGYNSDRILSLILNLGV